MNSSTVRIDVHNHIIPPFSLSTVDTKDNKNWDIPEWTEEQALQDMDKISVHLAILSLSLCHPGHLHDNNGREYARKVNETTYSVVKANPTRFGFFASVPSLLDLEGALGEISYAFDAINADGIILSTSYDEKYLGHEDFKPVWDELNKRKAVVFVHPSPIGAKGRGPIPRALIEMPYETTITATDLVLSNTIRRCPDVKIILAHAGGNIPYIVDRIAILAPIANSEYKKSREEILEDFKKFYFDTALGGSHYALKALLEFADPSRILFGSGIPIATMAVTTFFTELLDKYEFEPGQLEKINKQNSLALFPRLAKLLE